MMLRTPPAVTFDDDPSSRQIVALQLRSLEEGRGVGHDCSPAPTQLRSLRNRLRSLSKKRAALPTEYLPASVLQQILRHVGREELRALHRVDRLWREAVCHHINSLAPASSDPDMFAKFPKVHTLGLGGIHFVEPHLATLKPLQTIVLHDCTFGHPMKALTTLTGLQCCRLQDIRCFDSADMDAFLGSLTNLTSLEVLRTSRQSALPNCRSLSTLTQLQELLISDSRQQIQLTSLTQLSALSNLRKLTLAKVGVSSGVVLGLSSLRLLESLELPECYRVTDHALPGVSQLTRLTKLDLRAELLPREEDLSADGIAHLSGLTKLRELNLAGHCRLTSAALSFLSSFVHLQELNLAGTKLFASGASFLTPLTELRKLNLTKTHIAPRDFGFLSPGSMPHLTELNVSQTQMSDDSAPQIARLEKLETLDVSYTGLSGSGLLEILGGCPALRVATVDGCYISTLSMMAAIHLRPTVRMWDKEIPPFPTWFYKIDTMLIAQNLPHNRRLRVLHCGEGSVPKTGMVLVLSLAFFLVYFIVLFALFTAVLVVPLGVIGIFYMLFNIVTISYKLVLGTGKCLGASVTSLGNTMRRILLIWPQAAPDNTGVAEMV